MSAEAALRPRLRRRDGRGWGALADHALSEATPPPLKVRSNGVASSSISGWWGDQLWAGPHPTSTASGNASTTGGDQTSPPTGTLANLKDKLTQQAGPSGSDTEVAWLEFDFDAPPEPPCYVVDGLFERGTVNIVSADTGVGKTWVSLSLIAAALAHTDWLGRPVEARRVIAVDEENPSPMIRGRLRALGVTNEQVSALRYSSRQGVELGADGWNEWLFEQAVEHSADLILVDTAMAATINKDVNDNNDVTAIYKALRPIAEKADLAIVIFHHHRKAQKGQSNKGGEAMMGGRQWAGQADAHVTLNKMTPDGTEEQAVDGHTAFKVELRVEKLRNGYEPPAEEIQIATQNEDGCLLAASVECLGAVAKKPSKTEALALKMHEALVESGPLKIGKLAEQLGESKTGGTWERARDYALDAGLIVKVDHGVYEAGSEEPAI